MPLICLNVNELTCFNLITFLQVQLSLVKKFTKIQITLINMFNITAKPVPT